MNIYKLDAIIDRVNIVTIGVFSKKKIAKSYKKMWESFNGNGIDIECYINKIELDKVDIDRILTPYQSENIKPYLRDYKIEEIGIK